MFVLIAKDSGERVTLRQDDFTWTTPGELLTLGSVCCSSKSCGCGRAFSGIDSAKATTFGIVAEMDDAAVRGMVYESKFVDGWSFDGNRQEAADAVNDEMVLIHKTLIDLGCQPGEEVRVAATSRTFTLTPCGRREPTTGGWLNLNWHGNSFVGHEGGA